MRRRQTSKDLEEAKDVKRMSKDSSQPASSSNGNSPRGVTFDRGSMVSSVGTRQSWMTAHSAGAQTAHSIGDPFHSVGDITDRRSGAQVEMSNQSASSREPLVPQRIDENSVVEEKFEKYFGCLHKPWERLRWQKAFCRVCRTRFGMSELIFCRALLDLGIFQKIRRGVIFSAE